jgi:hypothetical protein
MWVTRHRIRVASVIAVSALLGSTLTACDLLGNDEDELPPPVISDYLTGVQVLGGTEATLEIINQQLGTGGDGPAASVDQNATVVNGGSIQQTVTSEDPFTVLRVALEELLLPAGATTDPEATDEPSPTSTGAPARGYHQITFPSPVTEATVVMTIAQSLPADRFLLYFAAANASGAQGPVVSQDVQSVGVGTGDVQVSVSWDVDSDLDLHVVDPNGEEVFWLATESSSGGELDLDSNAGCDIDGVRNENVTWPTGSAPSGEYTVRVDLWDSCDVEPTHYVVTVQVTGQPTKTYSGTISGSGDQGEDGAGEDVATFTVTGGATPTA